MNVGVMGAGRVGLTTALVLSELGHDVALYDVDPVRVAGLRAGEVPFLEPDAPAALGAAARSGRWTVTDAPDALADREAVLIAVPTPAGPDGAYDLAAVGAACETLLAVRDHAGRRVRWRGILLRSTVLPGTTERMLAPLAAICPVGHLPEFLREGAAMADARRPDRIVVGADDPALRALVRRLFDRLETTWLETGIPTAELVKTANNALLSSCISFANELARLAETIDGVDAMDVCEGLHLDRRLRATVRAGIVEYLLPGPGFGGSCLAKDLAALAAFARTRGQAPALLDAALRINETQPAWFVERIERGAGGLAGRRVLVLGLAFKPGTDDARQSIAVPLCRELVARGASVEVHDPSVAPSAAAALLPSGVAVVADGAWRAVFDAAEAVLLVTPWPVYVETLPALLAERTTPLLFADARGILRRTKRAASVTYLGIGARPASGG